MAMVKKAENRELLTPSPIITVTPARAMVDETVRVFASHMLPRQSVTLYAYLISEKQTKWESWGHYITDADGNVRVACQMSQGGTYSGCEPMGLFWSMKPAPGSQKGSRLCRLNVMKPCVAHIQVFRGHLNEKFNIASPIAMTTIERWYIRPGVIRIPITQDDIRGTLFIPNGSGPFPLVIDLWGGGGGIYEYKSSLLASHGFAAAVLTYIDHPDLPGKGADIHYFEEACEFLCRRPDIDSENIGFIGTSHGTSVGLQIASESTIRLNCAVFTNGVFVRSEIGASRAHMAFSVPPGLLCEKDEDGNFLTCDFLNYHRILKEEGEQAFIRIYKKLKDVGKEHLAEVLRYPQAGHLLEPPYAPLCTLGYAKPPRALTRDASNALYIKFGGSPKPHDVAQEHSWKAILEFLDKHLRNRKRKRLITPSRL
ncbi:bile acid-CoA:amino acid N-acyltransferase-like isoform X2 [Ptychodera flava]|uniref:bile acid-CoA:amino acid N-acyltransferase-like isoform X2 n=1 Tax=Ptychodera flava TaxID=63121 RepID=UPI00396A22AC